MANISLVNFDESAAAELASALRSSHHSVCVFHIGIAYQAIVKATKGSPELIILGFSRNEREARSLVQKIVNYRIGTGCAMKILCVLPVYRGPQFQIELERQGAHVIYGS
jgi:hypothetical protein